VNPLLVLSLACGVIFGLGLVVSEMIDPAKVLSFLYVAGDWDPTLAFVFAGALAVALPFYQWTLRTRTRPVLAERFHLPDADAITPKLVAGSALFGVGWGLTGLCPGPALTALASLEPGVLVFVVGLFAGAATWRFGFAE
jgi:uncharacterized membrane protein YedE/YeeE